MRLNLNLLFYVIICLAFVNCKNSKKKSSVNISQEVKNSEELKSDHGKHVYVCPMKCEGDKVYSEPGKCPKCKMDLKEIHEKHDKGANNYKCSKCNDGEVYAEYGDGTCPKDGCSAELVEI